VGAIFGCLCRHYLLRPLRLPLHLLPGPGGGSSCSRCASSALSLIKVLAQRTHHPAAGTSVSGLGTATATAVCRCVGGGGTQHVLG
jgi:hypothetical protein